jgi:adenosylhomocysteine nucleosidase
VIGISAYPDEIASSRHAFEESGVLLVTYAPHSAWNQSLLKVVEDVETRPASPIDVDFIAFCALEEERIGFDSGIKDISKALVSGLNVHFAHLGDAPYRGALIRFSNMGLITAAYESALALGTFRTRVAFMAGICAGLARNASLGQLIVAAPAWEYQAGKWSEDGFEIAPLEVNLAPSVRAVIDHQFGQDDFEDYVEQGLNIRCARPTLRSSPILAPFASGSAVIADEKRLRHIEQQHRKIAALDMETYGVYYAAREARNPVGKFFSIKTVVDLADGDKSNDLHEYGCHVSARAAIRLAAALLDI